MAKSRSGNPKGWRVWYWVLVMVWIAIIASPIPTHGVLKARAAAHAQPVIDFPCTDCKVDNASTANLDAGPGNTPAAAGGDAARWWLLGVLTCLCLGILGAAGVGGFIFLRSRRKPAPMPAPVPIISQFLAQPASQPRQADPVPQATTLPKARLVVLQGLVDHPQFVLTSQTLTIGRETSNTLVVNDSVASRHHARIEPINNTWVIVDVNSVNGTRVNGKSISRHALIAGDRIEIGTAVMEFQLI